MSMKIDSQMLRSPASDDSFSDSSSASSSSTLASSEYSCSDSDLKASSTSASGSGISSHVHAASLVDPARHSPELLQLLDNEVSPRVIDYIVDCVSDVVAFALPSSCPAPSTQSKRAFTTFVRTLHSRAEVTLPTILTALVYVARARPYLSLSPQSPYALERIWLGALIAASKYTQDSTLKNVHWALCTGVFGVGDVGRIEREFLGVLDWELGVSEKDLLGLSAALAPQEGERGEREVSRGRTGKPSARVPVPALEPSASSPASSNASTSPRTPAYAPFSPPSVSHSHLASPPSASKAPSSTPHPASHRVIYPAQKQSPKPPRGGFKLHALLRAAASHVHVHRPHHAHEQPRRVAVH
ncbi:hypothetical protein FB451DRAFT_1403994 [Mycena latifolia]|nr:hypothetical protein FB451DRAFT_1403994 [Mycena latifolia]